MTTIETAPLANGIRLRTLWPPEPGALCRVLLAGIPRDLLRDYGSPLADLLPDGEWYEDSDGPVLLLGEAVMGSDGKYHPAATYTVADALRLTQRWRGPQRQQQARQQTAAVQRQERDQAAAEKARVWLDAQAETQRKEAQRRNPEQELAELLRRVAELEASRNNA